MPIPFPGKVSTGELVTVIELLSPTNKISSDGRRQYEEKRVKVLASRVHLVEIDLLRAGAPMIFGWEDDGFKSDYRILVSRAAKRPQADLYPFSLRDPIPRFLVPVEKGDPEPQVDLGLLLNDLYDRAKYARMVVYRDRPEPPLGDSDAAWADGLLRERNLR